MTIPTLMNCPHSGEGWCLKCVHALDAQLCNANYSNMRLNAQIERLEKQALNHSWQNRIGGSFSAMEIADANTWK